MRGTYEQEAADLGRRADLDLAVAQKSANEWQERALQAERELAVLKLDLKRTERKLRIASVQLRNAAAKDRKNRQQPSVGENLRARSEAAAPAPLKRSRKIIEA